jgi:transposase
MLQAYDAKLGSQSKIAKMFNVSRKCLCDLLRLRRQRGSLAPKPHGGGRKAAYEGKTLEHLRELIRRRPDATLEALRERTGVLCSLTAFLRKAKARTPDSLIQAIRQALPSVTASDVLGWFKECGYVATQA